jgi:hypothetical protein
MPVRLRNRVLACAFVLSGVVLPSSIPLGAQEPAVGKPAEGTAPVEKRAFDPSRRVPSFFGQIGLTPEQREKIYKIRAKHQSKVDELKKQLEQVQGEMLVECEAQLNDDQKKLLKFRREASAAKSAKAKSAQAAPAEDAAKPAR